MKIILLGPPGSGKGTIAKMLVRDFGYLHLSTGDMFREEIRNKTSMGKKAQEYISKGMLVPDEITIAMLKSRIGNAQNYILDGYPRTIPQAEAITDFTIDLVLSFDVPEKTVVERIAGRRTDPATGTIYHAVFNPPPKGVQVVQRDDDKPDAVAVRYQQYVQKTAPLIKYYHKKNLLRSIDASPAPERVYQQVKACLR